MIIKPKIVQKGWGEEVWIHNDEEYCGKLLRFFKAGNLSAGYSLFLFIVSTKLL